MTDTSETTAVTNDDSLTSVSVSSSQTTTARDPKPGWKTTEFWLSLVVAILPWLSSHVPAPWQAALSSVSIAVYTYSRGMAKQAPAAPAFDLTVHPRDKGDGEALP